MYQANKVKAAIVESGKSGRELAKDMGMSERQFYRKLNSGKWYPQEIQALSANAGWDEEKTLSLFLR